MLRHLNALVRHVRSVPAVVTGPALLAVAVLGTVFAILQLRADALQDARRDIANLALILGEQTARSVHAVDLILRDLQDQVAQMNADSAETFERVAGGNAMHRELKEKIARLPQVEAFSIIDARGRLASGSRVGANIGLDLSDREYFRHLSAHPDTGLFISLPTQNRTTGEWTIYFARRFSSSAGDFLGIALGGVPIRYFEDVFRAIDLSRSETFALTRRDGTILVRHPDIPARIGRSIPPGSPWHERVARGGGDYVSPGTFDDVARMVAVRPLRDYPLVVNAAVSESAALATWRQQAIFMGGGSALIFAYAAYLMGIARRQYARLKQSGEELRSHNEELRQTSDALISSQLHLADLTHELETILETMDQGLIMVDGDNVVVQCNSQAKRLLDLPDDLIDARPTFSAVLEYQWNTNRSGREEGSFEEFARKRMVVDRPHVLELTRPDGRVIEVRSIPLGAGGFVRTYTDITARKIAEDRVRYLAHHDDLTQLVNRVAFRERLQQAFALARTSARGVAVLYLDLDRFKEVNDTRGHEAGDRVLAESAQRMRASVRSVDTVARLGGDEFAIILPFLESEEAARQLAARLVAGLAEPFVINGAPARIGVSIGIAIHPADSASVDELLLHADGALYEAKRAGRNTFRFHNRTAEPLAISA
jgi:diguanylate cyclase (GGDEF)-like protein